MLRTGSRRGDGPLGRHQLGDLHGIERRALAQVVVADEEGEPAIARNALVLADRGVLLLVGRTRSAPRLDQLDRQRGQDPIARRFLATTAMMATAARVPRMPPTVLAITSPIEAIRCGSKTP